MIQTAGTEKASFNYFSLPVFTVVSVTVCHANFRVKSLYSSSPVACYHQDMVIFKEEISTIGSAAKLIYQGLLSYRIDPEPLFREAGIELEQLNDPYSRFPMAKLQKLWRLCVERTGDESFGLTVAKQMQPAALHGLGFAWLSSDTLRDALRRLVRFSRLLNTLINYKIEETADDFCLVSCGLEKWPDFAYVASDAAFAIFLRMCRITVVEEDLHPKAVYMIRPEPANSEPYKAYFSAPLYFESGVNKLVFDKTEIDKPLQMANPELARLNDETVIRYLARFDRQDIVVQVRSRIIEQLPTGMPDPAQIADSISISLRKMQRKLKEENTSYRALLEETRRELALQYMKEHRHSISEITYMLGFSEPSNFTRAFKRWTGYSPSDYRNNVASH